MAARDRRKEKIGTVTPYEILLLLDPDVPDERQSEIVSRTRDLIERGGGTWEGEDVWGRRKLAYEIDHKTEGVYHLLTFSVDPETLDEVSRVLKISDGVMRHMAVRRSERRPAGTVASAPADRQHAPERQVSASVGTEEE
jgi:small subunit ribosomal protein S6